MTKQMKRRPWSTGPAVLLATALLFLVGGAAITRAGGENDAGRGGHAAAVPIRTAPAKQGRKRLAEERAMMNAMAGKRDPFKVPPPPSLNAGGDGTDGSLPPGTRGLVIGQLRLEGIVRDDASNTMIAVVTNRSNLAYFLHVHEDVYNGVVSRITPDAIYFQQKRLDSGGRVDARELVLKLGPER
jgi:hypothetical protein